MAKDLQHTLERWEPHCGLDYACVMLPGETTDTASIYIHSGDPGERDRLILLIAAVPDMLEALERLVTRFGKVSEVGTGTLYKDIASARAAIALARGA